MRISSVLKRIENDKKIYRANQALVILIILLNFYTIALPFTPKLGYWLREKGNSLIPKNSNLAQSTNAKSTSNNDLGSFKGDRLVLPSIGINQPILTGESEQTVNRGVWMRPHASTPDKGSNTVLVGHRYSYHGHNVFYDLDKMKVGDKFLIYWQGKEYNYEVIEIKTVTPDKVEVEGPTSEPRLTMYTCTPIWTAKYRLVVVSKQIFAEDNAINKDKQ